MPSRMYWMPATVLWFAAMGWLFSTKILPTLTGGQPPGYDELLPKQEVVEPTPIRWTIRWNGRDIGWAENKISRSSDGTGKIASEVQFQQLPVDTMLSDLLGVAGRFAQPLLGEIGAIDLRVLTDLDFDHYGAFHSLQTEIDVGELKRLLTISGHVNQDKLDLRATVNGGDQATQVYREQEIHLPPEALLADSFSPRPRLANLRVGQTWTFQSYHPLRPHQPLSLIEASVEQEELLEWNGKMVRVRKVAYRRDAGSGLSSTRKPIGVMWVRSDGEVLRQDLWLANVKIQFIRKPSEQAQHSGQVSASERSVVSEKNEEPVVSIPQEAQIP